MGIAFVSPGALVNGSGPGPGPTPTVTYLEAIEDVVSTGDFHYWNFQDGNDRHGPFRDWGTASADVTLTANETASVFGFLHCGPRGPDYVGGVTAKKWGPSDGASQAQHVDADAMPLFTGPGAIGFWARRGTAAEKHLLLLQVQNAGSTVFYRTRLKILSDGKLQLTIEIPGSGNSVVVETDAAVWGASARMDWHFIVISQPDDGGGIDVYVDNSAVPVTRTYNGTATAATWIDDMLAYVDRVTGSDLFRLFGDENGNGGDEFSQAGIGGFFIVENQAITPANITSIWNAADAAGTPTDYVEGVIDTLTDLPVWWWNCYPVNAGGTQPNETRSGKESNRVFSSGLVLPTELRGLPLAGGGRRYAAFTADGFGSFADRISGQSTDTNADWTTWTYSDGAFVARVRAGTVTSGSGINMLFCWGQEPTSGPALQEGIVVSLARNTGSPTSWVGAIRVAFYKRESGVARVWWRDFNAGITDDQEFTLVIAQPADGGGPHCWIDGTEITDTNDVTNGGTTGPNDWFGTISTAAGGPGGINCFRVGPYINASGFNPWGGRVEDFVITDQVLTQTEVDAIETAIAEAEAWEPSADVITITMGKTGTAGSEKVGFDVDDSFGSVSGTPDFLTGGDVVEEFFFDNSTDEFTFRVNGTYAADAFKSVTIETPYGFHRMFTRRAKSHAQAGGNTTWVWDSPTLGWVFYVATDTAKCYFE